MSIQGYPAMQLRSPSKLHRNGAVGPATSANGSGVDGCTFAELVYAHSRLARRFPTGSRPRTLRGAVPADAGPVRVGPRRRRQRSYWCSHIESAVALTEKPRRFPRRPQSRLPPRKRLGDQACAGDRQAELHRLDELAIRARAVLSGVREAICLHLVAACRRAPLEPRRRARRAPSTRRGAHRSRCLRSVGEIDQVEEYYNEAANGQAQIVYVGWHGHDRGADLGARRPGAPPSTTRTFRSPSSP